MIPTIIIHLEKHKDRMIAMEKKIKKTILTDYKYFIAIDGENDLHKYKFKVMENYIDPMKKTPITVGEIGCALSHYFVWKYIVDNNIEKCLILEDDTTFKNNFNIEFTNIMELNIDYDLFYLCRVPLTGEYYNLGKETEVLENIVVPKYSYNLNAYVLTNNGAKKLLNINFLDNIIPIDELIPIMYDNMYPIKNYSKYFSNYIKLNALALKTDITNQEERDTFQSAIEYSRFYY
jgi:GR25 family glycosyltransferase involved in LPS biosynthesis